MMPTVALLLQIPTPPGIPAPPAPPDVFQGGGIRVQDVPPDWVPYVAIAFFVMIVLVAIGMPLARAWARRMDRRDTPPKFPSDVSARLERIEQAVEAMAVEVERVSEGQRFLTKIMTEMRSLPAPTPLEAARPLPTRAGEETR